MAAKDSRLKGLGRYAKLDTKLVVSFLVLGVLPALVLGWYSYEKSAGQLLEAAAQRLEDAAVTDGDMIDRNLFERYGDVQAFAANPLAQGDTRDRQEIVDFLTVNYGIYDVMLIVGMDGRVLTVNSVDGNGDQINSDGIVGRDVSNKDWFKVVASGSTPSGGTHYTDVHHSDIYTEVYGHEALNLPFTAPIYGPTGEIVAIWHNEASFDRVVSDILTQRREAFSKQGLVTIQTQVLRDDGVVLDDADHDVVLKLNLADAGLEAGAGATGVGGSSGSTVEENLRTGIEQINGYAVTDGALGFAGYGWGVLVRQESKEAAAPADALRSSLFVFALSIVVIVSAAGLWLARGLSRPLKRNAEKLDEVSQGNLGVIFDVGSEDEVGQMSTALNTALSSIGGTLAQVDQSANDLTGSATHLTALSREMSGAATDTSDQANEVAAAAEEISVTSNSVARAMDQMSASVREISDSTSDAARMSAQAVEVSTLTKERMQQLDTSASDIGNVVSVITSIAEQTDLLALNATIEAARVGEAGKGFAVVANEVKALASQTANATEEIQAKIEAIQSDAVGAVKAIAEISDLIDRVNETSTTIAGAVEEQSATTAEVTSSIQAVTDGTIGISETIAAVAEAAGTTTSGAATTLDAAAHLTELATELNSVLTKFKLSPEQMASVDRAAGSDERVADSSLLTSQNGEAPETNGIPPSGRRLEDMAEDLVNAGWR